MSRLLISAGMAATLLGLIIWQVATVASVTPDSTFQHRDPAVPARAAIIPNSDAPAASWIATALERPLFREDRRQPKPVLHAAQVDAPVRLVGVMTGPFGKRAIFVSPGSGKPIVATEGAKVSDFQVRSISPGEAVVESEGGVRTLRPSTIADPSSRRP